MRIVLTLILFSCCLTTGFAQDIADNSRMKQHFLFKSIEVGIPEDVKRIETNMEVVEEMGFAKFATADEKIEITIREMEERT